MNCISDCYTVCWKCCPAILRPFFWQLKKFWNVWIVVKILISPTSEVLLCIFKTTSSRHMIRERWQVTVGGILSPTILIFFFICSCHLIMQEVIMLNWNGRIHTSRIILAIPCGLACWGYICNQTEQIWECSKAGDDTDRQMDKTGLGKLSMWYSLGLSYELIYYYLQYTVKNTNLSSCPLHFLDKTLRLWKGSSSCHGTNHPWCTDF